MVTRSRPLRYFVLFLISVGVLAACALSGGQLWAIALVFDVYGIMAMTVDLEQEPRERSKLQVSGAVMLAFGLLLTFIAAREYLGR